MRCMRIIFSIILLFAALIVSAVPLFQRRHINSETAKVVEKFLCCPKGRDPVCGALCSRVGL